MGEGNDAWEFAIPLGVVDIPLVLIFLVGAAGVMVLIQLAAASPEVRRHVRLAAPKRVEDEEAELHPAPPPAPQSPWDDAPN